MLALDDTSCEVQIFESQRRGDEKVMNFEA